MDNFYPTLNNPNPSTIGSDLEELAGLHQDILGNRGLLNTIANQQGIPGFQPQETLEIHRPWIEEPVGAIPFDPQNSVALPATTPFITVLTFPCPAGYDGVIEYISCNFAGGGFVQSSGDIVWQLTIDNKPLLNFENILNEKGTPFQGRKIGRIRIYSGQIIRWLVSHANNPALNGNIICSLTGYVYPSRGN